MNNKIASPNLINQSYIICSNKFERELVCLVITTVSIVKSIKRSIMIVVRTLVSAMITRTILLEHRHLELEIL